MSALPAFLVLTAGFALVAGNSFSSEWNTLRNVLSPDALLISLSAERASEPSGAADCDLDIQRFLDALSRKELWAARVLDSSSFFITGILHGNLAALGNYDECLRAAPPGEADKYWPLYSLVEISVEKKKTILRVKRQRTPSTVNVDNDQLATFYQVVASNSSYDDGVQVAVNLLDSTYSTLRTESEPGKILERDNDDDEWSSVASISLGVCWLRSCGAAAPRKAVAGLVNSAQGALAGTGFRVRVLPPLDGAGDVGLPSKLSRGDWAVISICIVLATLVLAGTLVDLNRLRNPGKEDPGWSGVMIAFSAYTNGRRLISVGPAAPDALTAISGFRVFSMLWVILGHRYRFILDLPYTNKIEVLESAKDWSKEIVLAGPLSVDTFFVIAGILNAYGFFVAFRSGRRIGLLQFIVHRYIRLTPALALMVAIIATWHFHIGDGPLWLKLAGEERSRCQTHWWTTLLYVGNYVNPTEQCMMQSWYLMVDMQLHVVSILVLFPMRRWQKAGTVWLLILIAISCAIPFTITYLLKFRSPIPTNPDDVDEQSLSMRHLYYPAHTRATSYLFGLLIGLQLYKARFVNRSFWLRPRTVVAGWTLSAVLGLAAIFAGYPLYQFENQVNIWYSASYVGFYRLAWGISISWIVFACGTGYGGPVNALLSWSPFVVLGRLVYGIYLVHPAIQMVDAGSIRNSEYFNDFRIVQRALSDFVISAVFGALLSLVLESPITALEKAIRNRPRRRRSADDTPTPTSPPDPAMSVSAKNLPLATIVVDELKPSVYSTDL